MGTTCRRGEQGPGSPELRRLAAGGAERLQVPGPGLSQAAPRPSTSSRVLLSDKHVVLSAGQGPGLVSVSAGAAPAFRPAPPASAGEEERAGSSAEWQLLGTGAGPPFLRLPGPLVATLLAWLLGGQGHEAGARGRALSDFTCRQNHTRVRTVVPPGDTEAARELSGGRSQHSEGL